MHEWGARMHVSIADCAKMLTEAGDKIDRSALSRYCDTHGLKVGKEGRSTLVDFEAVKAHRAGNYQREVMSGGQLPLAPVAPVPAPTAQAVIASMPEHRQLKAVALRQALREEAEEEGRLTPTDQVDAGAAEAIVEMRSAFAAVRADFAERLAAELQLPPDKVRTLRAGLKRFERVGQERFARRIAQALRAGNETQGAAIDRLRALTWLANRLRGFTDRAREALSA